MRISFHYFQCFPQVCVYFFDFTFYPFHQLRGCVKIFFEYYTFVNVFISFLNMHWRFHCPTVFLSIPTAHLRSVQVLFGATVYKYISILTLQICYQTSPKRKTWPLPAPPPRSHLPSSEVEGVRIVVISFRNIGKKKLKLGYT